MMTAEQLKNSILKMAMQGKLVEQRSKEGTGEELYEEILNERQRLVKEGKIKKERVQTEKTEEPPFDIPESWKWAKLNDIVAKTIKRGKSPKYTQKSDILVFAQKCNTKAGIIDLSLCLFLDDNQLSKYPEEEFMVNNDIVINSTGNGTLGRVNIYRDSDNPQKMPIVPDSHVTVIRCNKQMEVKYVFYCLKYYQPYMEKLGSGSTNQTELGAGILKELAFPIPPLEEQKRIVAKIEVLMPFVEQYAAASTKLNTLNAAFPEMMKKSILLEAVQGKLVPQDPNDEPASLLLKKIAEEKKRLIKEKKINAKNFEGEIFQRGDSWFEKKKGVIKCIDSELPYSLPAGWAWIRIGQFVNIVGGSQPPKSVFSSIPQNGYVRLIQIRDYKSDEYKVYIPENSTKKFCNSKDIMIGRYGPPIFQILRGIEGAYNVALMKATPIEGVTKNYLYYLLKDPNLLNVLLALSSRSCGQDGIDMPALRNYLVGLPPLNEQERIAKKLDEILPMFDNISF